MVLHYGAELGVRAESQVYGLRIRGKAIGADLDDGLILAGLEGVLVTGVWLRQGEPASPDYSFSGEFLRLQGRLSDCWKIT